MNRSEQPVAQSTCAHSHASGSERFRWQPIGAVIAALTVGPFAIAGLSTGSIAGPSRPCVAQPASPAGGADRESPHAYFEELTARPECFAAYSLRDQAQLLRHKQSAKRPPAVTYDPANDLDPRRQDAAKLVVPAGKVSLPNQLRLPLGTIDGTSTLVTWDAWFGAEFRHALTGIGTYKTFQFASPADRIWFEVRTRFKQDAERQLRRLRAARKDGISAERTAPARSQRGRRSAGAVSPQNQDQLIGMVDARAYGGQERPFGPNVSRPAPLSPQIGTFAIQAETWTRYWVLIEQRADDWDLVSLWVADENQEPVQLLDRRQLNARRSVESFWLEYNTSSKGRAEGLTARVAYARNVVMLRDVRDMVPLLRRPRR